MPTSTAKRLFIPSADNKGNLLNTAALLGSKAKHADKYNYLLHYLITARCRDQRLSELDYIPVSSRVLDKYVTSHNSPAILKFWQDQGVIEREPRPEGKTGYIVGQKSISYRFTEAYRDERVVNVGYVDKKFEQKVDRIAKEFRAGKLDLSVKANAFINFNLRELRINAVAAHQLVNERLAGGKWSLEKANVATVRIQAIKEWDWFCTRDTTGNRIHHNFAVLNKMLRPTCYLESGEALVNIDISNSQPLLLCLLMKQGIKGSLPADVIAYIDLCETGKFYRALAAKLGVDISTEEAYDGFKKLMFRTIFYGRNEAAAKCPEWYLFTQEFPAVAAFITDYKRKDYKALSVALQRLEAEIVIDGVIGKIAQAYRPDQFFAVTIHDSVTTTHDNAAYVLDLMHQEFTKRGVKANIEIQNIN